MTQSSELTKASAILFASAVVWPQLYSSLSYLILSPYERMLQSSWCGHALNSATALGHCPACWVGSASLALAGASLLMLRAKASSKSGAAKVLARA